MKRILVPICLALALSGCASVGSFVSSAVVATTSASSTQAKTVAEAIQATTLAEKALDVYVKSGAASKPVLQELQILMPQVHAALVKAEQANDAGNSALVAAGLAAFNEALSAVHSYETLKGIAQ